MKKIIGRVMSYTFNARDGQGKNYAINISKTGSNTAIIKVNQDSYNTSNLKRDAKATKVKGKAKHPFLFKRIDITLQISCNPTQPTFSIILKRGSQTFDFFSLGECIGLHSFIKSEIPTT